MPRRTQPLLERFLSRIVITESCWFWTGHVQDDGYGRISIGGRHGKGLMVHKVAYELWVGPIPEGLVIDHTCHNADSLCDGRSCIHRRCVNPDHLEGVTQAINVARGRGIAAINANKVRCIHGHPFDDANTYVTPDGKRACKQCKRISGKQTDARRAPRRRGVG
jgi:hypothetical protein